MRILPWILLIVALVGMATVFIAGQREQMVYDRNGILLDAYDSPPYLSRITIHQGNMSKFAFVVDGKTVSVKEVAAKLGEFQAAVGHAKLPSRQLSSSDWVISVTTTGEVDWFSFRPYPTMYVRYDGKDFFAANSIYDVVKTLGRSTADIRTVRHNRILEAIQDARLGR
jgi:hypothetical protein